MNISSTLRTGFVYKLILFFIITILLLRISSDTSYAAVSFNPSVDYLLDNAPAAMTSGDFDGDGDIDLATTNYIEANVAEGVTIHLNNGDGNYVLGTGVSFSEAPISITSEDFDGDGDIDLAVAVLDLEASYSYHGNEDPAIIFFTNNGAGSFGSSSVLFTQGPSKEIIATDFNGDLLVDIAVIGIGNTISVFLNSNEGTFSNAQIELPAGNYVNAVVSADIDNDDDIDLVLTQGGNTDNMSRSVNIAILENNGQGFFNYNELINPSPCTHSAFIATDLDSDSDVDLAFPCGDAFLHILLQDDSGDFALQDPIGLSYGASGGIVSADLNNDGKIDFALSLFDGSRIIIILQSNSGNQQPVLEAVGNQIADEGQLFELVINATDPDNNTLTYQATNLPTGATFNPITRTFSWTPTFNQSGNYENIEFTVSDNGSPMELDVELIIITVGDINRAPELLSPGSQQVQENHILNFTIAASDPDNDTITLSAIGLPSGASFNAVTGSFSWTPTLTQSGIYTVTLTATDNGTPVEASTIAVVITVGDEPTPIELTEDLIDTVVSFNLPTNIENAYMANLQKVVPFIQNGQIQPSINQLNVFIGKVNQDYSKGKITLVVRNSLVSLAQGLIGEIQ